MKHLLDTIQINKNYTYYSSHSIPAVIFKDKKNGEKRIFKNILPSIGGLDLNISKLITEITIET